MAAMSEKNSERSGSVTISLGQNLAKLATNAKTRKPINWDEVTNVFRDLAVECEATPDYFMKPRFPEVLGGLVTIIQKLEDEHGMKDQLSDHHRAIFFFVHTILKDEWVRVALRDQYRLFLHLGVFFNSGLLPNDMMLLLRILDTLSRGMLIYWKPPELNILLENIHAYVVENKDLSQLHNLAFQILINLCLENPSCSSIGRLQETFGSMIRILKNTTSPLGTNLLLLYQAMLPVEVLNIGYEFLTEVTANVCVQYRNKHIPHAFGAPTFLQLADTMETIAKKLGPVFTLQSSRPEGDPQPHLTTILQSKETFIRMISETLSQLKTFVTEPVNHNTDPKVQVDILKLVLSLLPSYVPTSLIFESIKEALYITNKLYKGAAVGSAVNHSCLSVYLYIVEQLLNKEEGNNAFDKLVSEKFFANVFPKLSLFAEVHPLSVEKNVTSIRLICLFSESVFGAEGRKKLDLPLLRSLVVALSEPTDLLPNIQSRRSICVVELLATMTKYSICPDMMNQLLKFVSSPNVSKQIAYCMFNGDERMVRNGLAISAATAFSDEARVSISQSIIKWREAGFMLESRTHDNKTVDCPGTAHLDTVMKRFTSLYDSTSSIAPSIDDLMSWYNLKLEIHKHELALANQTVTHLQTTIEHFRSLIDKQFELVSREKIENAAHRSEQLLVLKASSSQQKKYSTQLTVLEAEIGTLTAQLEEHKGRVTELERCLVTLKAEKEELLKEFKKEEEARAEVTRKCKTFREDNKILKVANLRLEKELNEKNGNIEALEISLKQKEEEARQNKLMFDNEKKKLDTIRTVVGSSFGTLLD